MAAGRHLTGASSRPARAELLLASVGWPAAHAQGVRQAPWRPQRQPTGAVLDSYPLVASAEDRAVLLHEARCDCGIRERRTYMGSLYLREVLQFRFSVPPSAQDRRNGRSVPDCVSQSRVFHPLPVPSCTLSSRSHGNVSCAGDARHEVLVRGAASQARRGCPWLRVLDRGVADGRASCPQRSILMTGVTAVPNSATAGDGGRSPTARAPAGAEPRR